MFGLECWEPGLAHLCLESEDLCWKPERDHDEDKYRAKSLVPHCRKAKTWRALFSVSDHSSVLGERRTLLYVWQELEIGGSRANPCDHG